MILSSCPLKHNWLILFIESYAVFLLEVFFNLDLSEICIYLSWVWMFKIVILQVLDTFCFIEIPVGFFSHTTEHPFSEFPYLDNFNAARRMQGNNKFSVLENKKKNVNQSPKCESVTQMCPQKTILDSLGWIRCFNHCLFSIPY